ncbi:MAG TPA: acylphosphatase [Ardenticatenaceae bacterium]|nr:acylphosphatase [Ardenticatenaceae bacterium]
MAEADRGAPGGRRRVHLFVTGRVQGVFFRATTRSVARNLGLAGWVRNLADGRVEIVAEGAPAAVDQLLRWVAVGPDGAHVTNVESLDEPATGEPGPFHVRS